MGSIKHCQLSDGVSTHSHPKVAALGMMVSCVTIKRFQHTATRRWLLKYSYQLVSDKQFQHTATRRWLPAARHNSSINCVVSTHSHPKVAAVFFAICNAINKVSTHSHPKVAACNQFNCIKHRIVSTHSHPKVAAELPLMLLTEIFVSTHSHPKVAAKS